jgi:high affinity sulfate transporter 1
MTPFDTAGTGTLARFIPALEWGRTYQRAWLPTDVAAGITLGAVMVPVGLAFGELAGLPLAGLYAGIAPLIVYALFGSSRQLIVGPDATMATVVAVSLAPLAAGDPARLAALVALLAGLMCGVFLLAGFLRLGFMADFLAKPVIVGFMHGLAVVILVGQLPKILGVPGGGETTLAQLGNVLQRLGHTHLPTFIVGVWAVGVILAMRRWVPRVPGQVVALAGSLAAVHLLRLDESGVAVVGSIPGGLPTWRIPRVDWNDLRTLLPVALGAAALGFSDTIATARGFASRNRYTIDANQELFALGLGNFATCVTQGLPISGSGSRTAVAESSGSRTQFTSIVAALTVAVVMLFLTSYLSKLPSAALGGILVAAAIGLCEFGEFRRLWNFRGIGLATALVVMAGVIGIGVMEGILLGVTICLVLVFRALTFPGGALLGRTADGFHDMAYHPDARAVPGAIIYRFSGPLFFANCSQFRSRIQALVAESVPPPNVVVLDASVIFIVDLSACDTLIEVGDSLRRQGIRLAIVDLRSRVKPMFARGGVTGGLGEDVFFSSVAAALAGEHGEPRTLPYSNSTAR